VSAVITRSAAIGACEKGQQCQQASHLLRGLQHHDIAPDVIMHSAAVSAREECLQCKQASYLLRAMQHPGFVPVVITHRAWRRLALYSAWTSIMTVINSAMILAITVRGSAGA